MVYRNIILILIIISGVIYLTTAISSRPITEIINITTKPGQNCKPMDPTCPGFFQVTLLSTSSFDATKVVPHSLKFYEGFKPTVTRVFPYYNSVIKDTNGDGQPDMVVYFNETPPGISAGGTLYCLTGTTTSGISFKGCSKL